MTRCQRFEQEGVLLVERGEALPEHFATCPDCLAARAAHERLRNALGLVGEEAEPPPGWQGRVWQEIERRRAGRRRPWLWLVPVGLAAALVGLVLVLLPRPVPAPALTVAVTPGDGPVRRGAEARPGDRLELAATADGSGHAELRVYLNDRELVLACSDRPPCERRGDRLTATLELPGIGRYQPVLLTSEEPIPPPAAGLDADAAAALDEGAEVTLGRQVEVR